MQNSTWQKDKVAARKREPVREPYACLGRPVTAHHAINYSVWNDARARYEDDNPGPGSVSTKLMDHPISSA